MRGFILGALAWVWLRTLRLTLETHPDLPVERPWVLVFFHGKQWPLLAWKRRRSTVVMVSHSKDGALQSRALTVLGFDVVRGSSSKGGARGLAALVRHLRRGDADAAFAVDGPRGPYGIAKPGARMAAGAVNAAIIPMGSAIAGGLVLKRAWDRFALAWPFGRVAVVLGAPLLDDRTLEQAIEAANLRAEALLAAPRTYMVASRPIE